MNKQNITHVVKGEIYICRGGYVFMCSKDGTISDNVHYSHRITESGSYAKNSTTTNTIIGVADTDRREWLLKNISEYGDGKTQNAISWKDFLKEKYDNIHHLLIFN